MAKLLLLPYHRQAGEGYCLAACAQMALEYLGLRRDQGDLARRLKVRPGFGAWAANVTRLRSRTLDVTYTQGELQDINDWIARDVPVIAFVQAGELPHWRGQRFRHAVVVVGMDEQAVYFLDPAATPEPIVAAHGDFQLAWEETEPWYAVFTRPAR